MSDPSQRTEKEDAARAAYDVFLFTVEVLALSPDEQCERMGDYNTAWELREDTLAGRYLLGSGLFTCEQEQAVSELLAAVDPVPVQELPSGAGRAANLAAMQHPAWEPARALAGELLNKLGHAVGAGNECTEGHAP